MLQMRRISFGPSRTKNQNLSIGFITFHVSFLWGLSKIFSTTVFDCVWFSWFSIMCFHLLGWLSCLGCMGLIVVEYSLLHVYVLGFLSCMLTSFFFRVWAWANDFFRGEKKEKIYVKLGESVLHGSNEGDNRFFSERILMPDYVLGEGISVVHWCLSL